MFRNPLALMPAHIAALVAPDVINTCPKVNKPGKQDLPCAVLCKDRAAWRIWEWFKAGKQLHAYK